MQSILLERIGGDVSQNIAKCLLEYKPDLHLVGMDRNPDCGWEGFVKEFVLEGKESPDMLRFPYMQKDPFWDNKLKVNKFLELHG
ncbi:hypothetical protein, partial [Mycobacteroides chelonae]|uniref:hypothetical protein n=1 Tax=Mycobacteroides chelonae TaxID=1774 RepID=UPI0010426036